jgi:hypothetical protein
MSKICKIGTKEAILDNLKKNRVIASDGKILKQNALLQMHFVYKDYLSQTFGINRDLILTNAKHTYIQFNTPALEEIDALYGLYYPENERFRTNVIDNTTLTPVEVANKYIKVTKAGEIALKKPSLLLNQEDLQKFKIGMSEIFPEYAVEYTGKKNISTEKLFAVNLKKQADLGQGVNSKEIDGIPSSESDLITQMNVVTQAIEPLMKMFKNVKVHWIDATDIPIVLASAGKPIAMKNGKINALAIRSNIFLVKGRVTPKTAIEEFMHMFVDTVALERPSLYQGLKNKAFETRGELYNQIVELYPEELFGKDYIEKEFVTQALRDAYIAEREERPQGIELNEFQKVAQRFFKWLLEKLNKIFDNAFAKPRLEISELPLDMTLQDVAVFLNVNDVEIPYLETTDVRFSIDAEEGTEDSFIENELSKKVDLSSLSESEIQKLKVEEKIEKTNNQIKRLKKLKSRYTSKKLLKVSETLDKLIAMSYTYLDVLQNNVRTVSVTNFTGNPEFSEASQQANKKYQSYGVFLHNFMEHLQDQVLFSEKEKTSPILLYAAGDYEIIRDYYNKHKDEILLKGVTEEKIITDMIDVVAIVNQEFSQGNLCIPEITIIGTDSLGRGVVGRIDYLVVRPDGTTATRDFKTNKVMAPLNGYTDFYLHKRMASRFKLNPDVHPAFEAFPGRSKVSSYLSQVGTYKRILAQAGIKSVDDAIINIVYGKQELESGDPDEFVYDEAFVKMIQIEGEFGLKYVKNPDGSPSTTLDPLYERVLSALNRALPVEGEETDAQTKAKAVQDIKYIENLNEDSVKRLVANLKDKIQTQLESIKDAEENARANNADESVLKKLKERKTTLYQIQAQFDSTYKTEEGFKEISDQVILKGALDKVIEVVANINKECKELAQHPNESFKINALRIRFEQINDLKNFLDIFSSILLENGVPEDSELIKEITEGIVQSNAAKSEYIKVSEDKFVEMLLKVNKKTAEAMMKDYKSMITPRIQMLQKIANGDGSAFQMGATYWLSGLKKLVGMSVGQGVEITTNMKDAARAEMNRINNFIQYEKFDRDFVKLYVENTFNNPEHGFYIGSTITTGFGGLSSDDLRSAFGNSELAITAAGNFLINSTIQAKTRFNQLMEDLKIDSYIERAAARVGGYRRLNTLLSERVTVLDKEGNPKDFMKYIGPIAQEYFNTYDKFDYEISQISKQIEENNKKVANTDAEKDEKTATRKKLSDEKKEKLKKFMEWLVKNAETKLKAEVYLLEVSLPAEIQDKIKELNDEILSEKNNKEDFELSNTELDNIQRLELEIEKLRRKAVEEDPSLTDIFDQYQKYYTYEINYDKFNYMQNKMIKKYGEESPEYQTWLELNSELIPVDDFYQKVDELQQEIGSYFPDNAVLTGLYEERKELIDKYKFKSKFSVYRSFNAAYMSEADSARLDELEEAIEFEQQKPKNRLSKEDARSVDALKNQLNSMRESINKPSFTKALNDKIKELLSLHDKAESETDVKLKEKYRDQFNTREQAFKHWYERNNSATYAIGTILKRGSVNAVPKKFNTMYIPTDPNYMERMPTSKYKSRYYTEEAYNPDYRGTLEKRKFGAGEYALPKGISYENGRWIANRNSPWYNEAFATVENDANLMDAYNTIVMDMYYNKQKGMNAKKLGLFFPGVMQNAYDSIATDGVQGLKRELNEAANNLKLKNSTIDEAANTYGIAGKNRVTFSHNYLLDADLVTKDGINAAIQWAQQYEVNKSMEEASLVISPAIDFLRESISQINDPVRKKQVQKVIDIIEYERNRLIYGQTTNTPSEIGKTSGNKLMKMFLSAVSWGRLAFDPAMQVGNLISGNVQTFLATQMKGAGTAGTLEDYLWAKGQLYGRDGFMYNLISDWGGLSDLTLSTKIFRFMDPTLKGVESLDLTSKTKTQRLLRRAVDVKDLAFVIQDKGEMEIALTTMLKTLKASKFYIYETDTSGKVVLDAEGNKVFKKNAAGEFEQISAYDALVNVDGSVTPGIREDVAMTLDDLEGLRGMIQQEYLRHQGNYSSLTKSPIEGSFLGQLLMFFRKYLVPAVEVRFKGMFDSGDPRNWVSGEAQLGWWTGFFKLFQYYGGKEGLKELILPNFLNKNSSVDLYYRNKMFQVKKDVLAAVAFATAYAIARSLIYTGSDDDDEELTWAQMQSLRVLVKVANETRSLTPLPHWGKMDDYITNFSTFTTAFSEGKNLVNLVENMGYYAGYEVFDSDYAFDLGYYQKRSGRYEKGDPKFYKGLAKLTGIENIQDIFEPEYALKQQYQGKK